MSKDKVYNYFTKRIKEIIIDPKEFFKNLKKEKGIGHAITYLLILFTISHILSLILSFFYTPILFRYLSGILGVQLNYPTYTLISMLGLLLFSVFLVFIGSFVWAGLLYLWALIFGGKGSYIETYKLLIYSRTPVLLLGWIPIIGSLAKIYDLLLLIIGTQEVHKISKGKTLVMYLIPVGIWMIFIILMIVVIAFSPNILRIIMNSTIR